MSKLAKLRNGFASGMSEARISDDQWNDEFLPMLADAERYAFLRRGGGIKSQHPCPYKIHDGQRVVVGGADLDAAIDAAIHNNEKE